MRHSARRGQEKRGDDDPGADAGGASRTVMTLRHVGHAGGSTAIARAVKPVRRHLQSQDSQTRNARYGSVICPLLSGSCGPIHYND